MDDVEIEAFDPRDADEEALRELYALSVSFGTEAYPQHPPTPFEVFVSGVRARPSYRDRVNVVARRDGEMVATTDVDLDRSGSNAHVVELFTYVRPDHRGKGLSRPLLDRALDVADDDNRTRVISYTASTVPSGAAYLKALGATLGLVERESELDLTSLDRDLIARWVAEGPERAPGYELLTFDGPLPDEMLEQMSKLYEASNDAPLDDLDVEHEHRSPEQLAESQRVRFETGWQRVLIIARHRESGEFGGWTELGHHPSEAWKVGQYWTAVDRDHRGHALGKWIKAANLVRALERWPQATHVLTTNAYTNDAMLGINNQLGFKESMAWSAWQNEVEQLRGHLGS